MKQARGCAHGKVILIGEHAVVYHYPCIALPIKELQVQVDIQVAEEETLTCDLYCGPLAQLPAHLANLACAIQKSKTYCHCQDTLAFTVHSDLPAERGMGSSAAVACALIRSIFHYCQQDLPSDVLLQFINEAETLAHGKPSGIDAITTSQNEAVFFIKGQALETISMNLDADLIIADTGQLGDTKEAVSWVASQAQKKETKEALHQLGQLSLEAKLALEQKNVKYLGQLLNKAQVQLERLGVSNATLNDLVQTARAAGAYGSKLTGGGRGGCMLALCSKEKSAAVYAALQKKAKQVWKFNLKEEG